MTNLSLLAAVSGEGLVQLLIWLVCMGLIFWLISWFIDYIELKDPIRKVAKVILALAVVVVLINVLLSLAGHPLIRW